MSEAHFARLYPREKYRFYSLCCHKLLDSYEELSEVCDIDTLVDTFDMELRSSYCGDEYALAVESMGLALQRLINRYNSNTGARDKLTAIHQAVLNDAGHWDFLSPLHKFRDIGRGIAQDFYREGRRNLNIEMMNSKAPELFFSNLCLSEDEPSAFTEPRPISTLSGRIHLPFTESFGFRYYLSYPVLFLHEYVSHVYVPEFTCRTFDDGWLMYAIELFMKTRWTELCEKYPLICEQINVLKKIWKPRFTRLAKRGYDLAENVNLWIGNDRFLHFTWDLASYPCNAAGHFDLHSDFLNRIRRFISRDKRLLLRSAVENSTNVLQLYENLGPEL
jgi:hypothetical protein